MDNPTAILLAAILATLGWITSQRAGRMAMRKQHTFSVIKENRDNQDLRTAIAEVRKKRDHGVEPRVSPETKADYQHYDTILNHYEYICAALITGDLDEELLLRSERSRIIQIDELFAQYIREKAGGESGDTAQNTLYENLHKVAVRWRAREKRSLPHIFYEYITMRPYFQGELKSYLRQFHHSLKQGFDL